MQQTSDAATIDSQRELTGQVALVTGGGQGLGEALCRTLARAGATVIVADRRRESADTVAERISRQGGAADPVLLDVTDHSNVALAVARAVDRHGRLDIVVNNAGINHTKSIEELTIDEWDAILDVNLRGPFVVSKAALPVMRSQGGGSIVNIVSTAAKRAWANASAYHASKWGLLGFSHALHVEARKSNVKVTAVVAGGMRTPFLLEPFPDIDVATLQDPMNVAETVRRIISLPPETVVPEVLVLPMRETSWP